MNKKEFLLTIDHRQVRLTITKQSGYCDICQQRKQICLISQRLAEVNVKNHCWSCSLESFYHLEQGDYQIKDKQTIIKQLRAEIMN